MNDSRSSLHRRPKSVLPYFTLALVISNSAVADRPAQASTPLDSHEAGRWEIDGDQMSAVYTGTGFGCLYPRFNVEQNLGTVDYWVYYENRSERAALAHQTALHEPTRQLQMRGRRGAFVTTGGIYNTWDRPYPHIRIWTVAERWTAVAIPISVSTPSKLDLDVGAQGHTVVAWNEISRGQSAAKLAVVAPRLDWNEVGPTYVLDEFWGAHESDVEVIVRPNGEFTVAWIDNNLMLSVQDFRADPDGNISPAAAAQQLGYTYPGPSHLRLGRGMTDDVQSIAFLENYPSDLTGTLRTEGWQYLDFLEGRHPEVRNPVMNYDSVGHASAIVMFEQDYLDHRSTVQAIVHDRSRWTWPTFPGGLSSHQTHPDVSVGADGSFMAAWEERDAPGAAESRIMVSWSSSGYTWTNAVMVAEGQVRRPHVAVDRMGHSGVYWISDIDDGHGVSFKRFFD